MRHHTIIASASLLGLATVLAGFAKSADHLTAGLTTGAPAVLSAEALALGPDGVVFVGDSRGAAVYALALGDKPASASAPLDIANVDAKIAALLGTTRSEIVINDMVANPTASTVYLSVTRGRGPDAKPALVRVTPTGALEQVRLDSVTFSKLDIEQAPAANQKFVHPAWRNSMRRDYTVTALNFSDGELYVSGVTNEEFASSLRRVAFPFNGKSAVTKVSMYHTSHGMYETEAPIAAFLPVSLGGERVILAGYLCTPLATFSLKGLTAGGSLRGKTVIELGSGNGPRDIATFERAGERYVVVATGRGWMARFRETDLARAPGLASPVDDKAGVVFETPDLKGVREIEPMSKNTFVVLQRNADNTFALRTVDSRVL